MQPEFNRYIGFQARKKLYEEFISGEPVLNRLHQLGAGFKIELDIFSALRYGCAPEYKKFYLEAITKRTA
jgi:hypothetical protein